MIASRPALALLALGMAAAPSLGQDAYIRQIAPDDSRIAQLAAAVTQPMFGDELVVVSTDTQSTVIHVSFIDDQGVPVQSFDIYPPVSPVRTVELISYEVSGQELFALLAEDAQNSGFLFVFDATGQLYADVEHPVSHPLGAPGWRPKAIAWDPKEERLAILGHVSQFAYDYDVGLMTTGPFGKVTDEMRWYEFGFGSSFNSSQAVDLVADPNGSGFLVLVHGTAFEIGGGVVIFPVQSNGDPQFAATPWLLKSFQAKGMSLDFKLDQVIVYGEDFAIGGTVNYRDVCFWVDNMADVFNAGPTNSSFQRFHHTLGQYETVRDGLFPASTPSRYVISGQSANVPTLTWFNVNPGSVQLARRSSSWNFGAVTGLVTLPNYTQNGAGYPLDLAISGWTNGYYNAYTRRSGQGELDPACEQLGPKVAESDESASLTFVSIDVIGSFDPEQKLGSKVDFVGVEFQEICDYPGFRAGTAK